MKNKVEKRKKTTEEETGSVIKVENFQVDKHFEHLLLMLKPKLAIKYDRT